MSVTAEQARAIAARGKIIVAASAGSGKTFVMIERIISLVVNGEADVRELLAVTFTNKAAAQLRERLRSALVRELRKAEGEKRRALKAQLDALPLAEVSTIHAFCGRLIRTYFYLADIDPRFTIASPDEARLRDLSARALDEVFDERYERGDEEFTFLLSVYFRKKKDRRLREIVVGLYERMRQERGYREKLETVSKIDDFDRASRYLFEEFCRRAQLLSRRIAAISPTLASDAPKGIPVLEELRRRVELILNASGLYSMCARCREEGALPRMPQRKQGDVRGNAAIDALRAVADSLKGIYAELAVFDTEEAERERYLDARRYASALASLTLSYADVYERIKREAGVVDYSDLEHLALAILTDPDHPEVREAVRQKRRFLFVDEYQDVNLLQEEILRCITGEEAFLVGDKKQAIYGFRGSKSRYFTEKERAFAPNNLTLSVNFRSADAVLDAVNRVFSEAMKGDYTPVTGGGGYAGHAGEVLAYSLPKKEREKTERGVYSVKEAAVRRETDPTAEAVAEIVAAECGGAEGLGRTRFDVESGKEVPVRFGDIVVLVRKNTRVAGAIVRTLSELGVPVTSTANVNVFDYFEARLLLDWLSYLDNPEQDIPMATAMLSAIGGFSDRELALIRLRTNMLRGDKSTFRAACRLCLSEQKEGNDPLCKKLGRFFALTRKYRDLTRVRTASEMLVLLLADGLEAQIVAKGDGGGRLARVRRLVAESEGAGSVHAFLEKLSASGYFVDFSESGGENAVRVLTIHSAKGLEAPIVILTELDEDFHRPDSDDTAYTEEFGIAPRSFDPARRLYRETVLRRAARLFEMREDVAGEKNLLYVAMTRASYRLHLLFSKGIAAASASDLYSPDDAMRLSDFIPRGTFSDAARQGTVLPAETPQPLLSSVDEGEVEAILAAGMPYPHAGSVDMPVKDSATGLMHRLHGEKVLPMPEDEGEDRTRLLDMDPTSERGTAYHAFLEHVRFGGDAGEELARMREENLLSEEMLSLLDKDRLYAILEIPCLKALEGKRTLREQSFLALLPASDFADVYASSEEDEVIFQGAIDLIVDEGEGRFTVIDYKYSSRTDEALKQHYSVQLRLYKKVVARVMRTAEEKVSLRIVNIAACREIEL